MTEVELLPPLYRIVYEYLPVSEQWYVSTLGQLDQFAKFTSKLSEYEIMSDAVVNNNMHVYIRALEVSKLHYYLHRQVLSNIVELDRVEMLRLHAFDELYIQGCMYQIMMCGAVQIMRYAIELCGKASFRPYVSAAACHGRLGCLQELARADPEYEGSSSVFLGAVISDDVKVVEFVANAWPKARNMVSSTLHGTAALVASGSCVKSAKMTKYVLERFMVGENTERVAEWARCVLNQAFVTDSDEILEVILTEPRLGHCALPITTLYLSFIGCGLLANKQTVSATKVYRYLDKRALISAPAAEIM